MPSIDVAADGSGLREARRFVGDVLVRWGIEEPLVHDAQLLTTELVTNALIHARSRSTVTVSRAGADAVRVEVADQNAMIPEPRRWGPDAVAGRGLRIVERLSSAWGVIIDATGEGKVVWFELDAEAYDGEPGSAARGRSPEVPR